MREQKKTEEKSKRKLNHASIIRAQKEIRLYIHVEEREQDVASIVAISSARTSDLVFCADSLLKISAKKDRRVEINRDKHDVETFCLDYRFIGM